MAVTQNNVKNIMTFKNYYKKLRRRKKEAYQNTRSKKQLEIPQKINKK